MNTPAIATIVAWVLIGLGAFSIFLPIAPSIPIVWFGILVYAIGHNFAKVNQNLMGLITAIALFTIFLDYSLAKAGIQKFRAGFWEVIGAVLGFIVGSFFSPIIRWLIAPVVGAIAFASLRGRDQVYSFKTGNVTVVAFMGGTIVKMIAAVMMIGIFVLRIQGKL